MPPFVKFLHIQEIKICEPNQLNKAYFTSISSLWVLYRGGQKLSNRPESDETEKEFDCWVVVGRVTG
jgi:hypothetical protein